MNTLEQAARAYINKDMKTVNALFPNITREDKQAIRDLASNIQLEEASVTTAKHLAQEFSQVALQCDNYHEMYKLGESYGLVGFLKSGGGLRFTFSDGSKAFFSTRRNAWKLSGSRA